MPRFLTQAAVAALATILLVACTLSIQPLKKGDPYRSQGRVENVTCPPYFAPSFDPMPELPDFTDRERANDTLFKRKLAKYTEKLQDYVDTEHEKQRAAWRAYARECHIL